MGFMSKNTGINQKGKNTKFIIGFGIAFLMSIASNLTSYAAFQRPNTETEVEPNNTWETAQRTYRTNEVVEKFAASDRSGRYSMIGAATSSDDDWYKVDLPAGIQYVTVMHYYSEHATYVEVFDSEKKVVIPTKYGTGYNVTEFDSKGGTYYIHIVGATEDENEYTLLVGTPMLRSDEVWVSFDSVNTSGTVRKTFSLADEVILPKDAVVAQITLRDLRTLGYSSARVSSSSSSSSITFKDPFSGNIAGLGMDLKSTWTIEYYPQSTVKTVPIVDFLYYYPVYDDTRYPHLPTIKK